MTALCIIMAVLAAIALVLLLPVGAEAEYNEPGATLWLRIGAFRKILYPRPPKPEERKKKQKEKKPKDESAGEKPKKGGTVELIMQLLPVGIEALGRVRRGITVKKLQLWFCHGGDDPAKVAMMFGGTSAGAGMLVPLLHNNFRIKETDIRNSVDFNSAETRVYGHADIRIRVGTAIAIAAAAGIKTLKIFLKRNKQSKSAGSAPAAQKQTEAEKGR